MAKDSLAQGARSATFSAGQAEPNDPIEFHGTVAEEAEAPESPTLYNCGICGDAFEPCRHWLSPEDTARLARQRQRPLSDFARYQPMNDRVLLRRIEEKNESLIIEPEAFAQKPNKAEVLAVGEGMLIGGELRPINLEPGDVVLYGEYNAEDIVVEGEKVLLVSAFDVRLKIRNASPHVIGTDIAPFRS